MPLYAYSADRYRYDGKVYACRTVPNRFVIGLGP